MTMIERVARALAMEAGDGSDWIAHRGAAVKAIEAMREPTDAMWEAGCLRWHKGNWPGAAAEPYLTDIAAGVVVWQRAIDAALTEPEAPSPR